MVDQCWSIFQILKLYPSILVRILRLPTKRMRSLSWVLDKYLRNQPVDHLDDTYEKIVEKALRHESLFPKEETVIIAK